MYIFSDNIPEILLLTWCMPICPERRILYVGLD